MKKILNVISSPRGTSSNSIQLAQALIDKLLSANPGATVRNADLVKRHFPHLEEAHLVSFLTPMEQHSEKDKEAIRHSDEAIREIMEADILVIGAPMYNFSIPSALKAWIDHVVRAGITFSYSEKGVEGLVKGKKVYLIISSGGIYSEGPAKAADFVEPYMRYMLSFMGLSDITVLRVEGLGLPDIKDHALENAIAGIAVS